MIAKGHYTAQNTKIGNRWVRFDRKGAGKRLNNHLKYVEYRTRSEHEDRSTRHLFTALESDGQATEEGHGDRDVTRREALEQIMSNAGSRVYYHQFVLSAAQDEPVENGRELVRATMKALEKERGLTLCWYAAEHANTEYKHWHIIVAGSGEDQSTGERRDLRMSVNDYRFIKETAHGLSEHEWQKSIDEHLLDGDQEERNDLRALLEEPDRQESRLNFAADVKLPGLASLLPDSPGIGKERERPESGRSRADERGDIDR